MNAGNEFRFRKKDGERPGERHARIRHANEDFLVGRKILAGDNRRGGAGFGGGKVCGVLGEGEVAGLGLVNLGEAGERGVRVAEDFAGELFCDFSGGKCHGLDIFG